MWCSPLPPVRSGVSDYAVELLAELGRLCSVRAVVPPGVDPPPAVTDRLPVSLVPAGSRPTDDEIVVAHLGNNPHHRWVIPYLDAPRTVAVVHDLVLHHLLVEHWSDVGEPQDLERELRTAHGRAGRALARARAVGYRGRLDPFLFPARRPFLASVAGVITHSEWGRHEISGEFPDIPVVRLPLTVDDPLPVDRTALRAELGLADHEVAVMHLGFLTPEKGLHPLVSAVAVARRAGVPVRLVMVGEGGARQDLERAVASLDLEAGVLWTGWVDEQRMKALPAAADLGVVLRSPSAGETSAAVLRFLAAGTPVAVTARRQFLEWSLDAVVRITPGASATADLVSEIVTVTGCDRGRRRAAARHAYERDHRPAAVAARWVDVLHRVVSGSAAP
jgi:glycosyltransferase involved in cell wall biosynthesis